MPCKKSGRPFFQNPKSAKLTVHIDTEEASILDSYCARKNIKRVNGVRDAIRNLKNKK